MSFIEMLEWHAETRAIGLFALLGFAALLCFAEVARIFFQAEGIAMIWPPCWFFLVLGYSLGRSGMRRELTRD